MPLTATCPHAQPDVLEPPPFTAQWHRREEAEERAWLDDWARTLLIPTTN